MLVLISPLKKKGPHKSPRFSPEASKQYGVVESWPKPYIIQTQCHTNQHPTLGLNSSSQAEQKNASELLAAQKAKAMAAQSGRKAGQWMLKVIAQKSEGRTPTDVINMNHLDLPYVYVKCECERDILVFQFHSIHTLNAMFIHHGDWREGSGSRICNCPGIPL